MTKTIISTAVVFAFGAFLVFAFVVNDLGKPGGISSSEPSPDPSNGIPMISLMHSYLPKSAGAGEHRYRGVMQLPTPCHRLNSDAAVLESFPEQIQIHLTTGGYDGFCIQVIDERQFEVLATASKFARLGLVTINGEPVQFAVQEEGVQIPGVGGREITVGQPFTLAFGEEKRRDDLSVRFMGVRADSRCPENADCVWAGEAVLEFQVFNPLSPEDAVETILLNFPGEESQTVPGAKSYALFNGYGIHLVGVSPANIAGQTFEKEAYRVTLVVNSVE